MAALHHQEETLLLVCFVLSSALFNLPVTFSFPSGAPKSSCFDLVPHHHAGGPQQSTTPYRIVVETTYTPQGTIVRGVITSSEAFKGFILQARNLATSAITGQFLWFDEEKARTLECVHPNDTLTHRNINGKEKVSFIWISDQNEPEVKEVQFQATVVKSYEQFWTNIHSNIVNLKEDKSSDSSLIPAEGTDTGKTPHDSNHDQGQQKEPTEKFAGKKPSPHSTSLAENEHRTGDGAGDNNQPPSSTVTQQPFQQPPPVLRPHQKQQWEPKQWPQNFPPISRLPQQHPSHQHQHQQQQQQQQQQLQPNVWIEPGWFVRPNRGFPSSAFSQSSRLNGQMPGNRWTMNNAFLASPADDNPVAFQNRDPIGSWSFSPDNPRQVIWVE